MKKLAVTIRMEMEIPEEWELKETPDGFVVLKLAEDQYLDFTYEPMVTDDIKGRWSNDVDDDFMDLIEDMMVVEQTSYKFITS